MTRIPFLFTCLLVAACGSTAGSRGSGPATSTKITLRDYRVGTVLAIVNDGYIHDLGIEGEDAILRRAAYYSDKRVDPSTKVADDELVAQAVDAIDAQGFRRHALAGPAPEQSGEATTCLEILEGDEARHMVFRTDLPRDQQRAYADSRNAFYDIYNNIYQYQAADPDQFQFDNAQIRVKGRD